MLTYLKIGIIVQIIIMIYFLLWTFTIWVVFGKQKTIEYLEAVGSIREVAKEAVLTITLWPIEIPHKIWIAYKTIKSIN